MLQKGDYVRVKQNSPEATGLDAMVLSPPDADGNLGVMFGWDRWNQWQDENHRTGLPELWHLSEFDLNTASHDNQSRNDCDAS